MKNYTFEQIKEKVFRWSQSDMRSQMVNSGYFETTKNERELLLIDLTFKNCLAQITVNNPIFAPYQYVSFEAMALESKKTKENGTPEIIYFFYDYEDMLENELIEELEFGIKLCSDYIPDKLAEIYLNKKGFITVENENLRYVMRFNNIKKYSKNLFVGDFMCKGIHAHYLIVENNLVSISILPQLFTINENI